MDEIEIFIDEDDPKTNELLVKYNKVEWIGASGNQTTIISYEPISWWRRRIVSWVLGILWSKVNVEFH